MKKAFLISILIIAIVAILFWIGKSTIASSYLSKVLRTKVSIEGLSVSTSRLQVKDFSLKDPTHGRVKKAFYCEDIDARYQFSKLFSDPRIIEQIHVKNAYIGVDCLNPLCSKTNWTEMLKRIQTKQKEAVGEKETIVKKFILDHIDIEIFGLGLSSGPTKTHIHHLEFDNVSSKEGFPIQPIIVKIFQQVGLQKYLLDFLEKNTGVDKVIEPFLKDILGEKQEELEKEAPIKSAS